MYNIKKILAKNFLLKELLDNLSALAWTVEVLGWHDQGQTVQFLSPRLCVGLVITACLKTFSYQSSFNGNH